MKFKVGDRVVCTVTYYDDSAYKVGNVGTVKMVNPSDEWPYDVYFDVKPKYCHPCYEKEIELYQESN